MDTLLTLENLEKNRRSNFYYSFLMLPKPKREAINIVYAWCRYADDIVDEEESVNRKYLRLRQWSREFESAIDGTSRYPLLNRLSQIIQSFHIPLRHFRDLLRGMEMDLVKTRYTSFAELREYCYYAASTVGLICTEIFGYKHEGAKEYAVNLGIALQLVNILRDVQSDAERGRIYIPQEDLDRFGYTEIDIRQGVYDQRFIDLMEFECDRARNYFETALKHLSEEDKPLFIAALIMQAIYFRILMEIKRRRYNVYGRRIRLSAFRKIMIALRVWWKNRPSLHHAS